MHNIIVYMCVSIVHNYTCREDKKDLRKINKQNNASLELLDDLNNAEQKAMPTNEDKECARPLELDPSIGVEETGTDQEQAEFIPTPIQRNVSSSFNVIDQTENLLDEMYPINTVATSQQTSPDLRDNDHQLVPGVTPSTNGAFVTTQASVNGNSGTTDNECVTDPAPSLCHGSPNHVPVPRNNQDAQVNAVPKCDTNDPWGASDLVRPPVPWPNLPGSVGDHTCQSAASGAQECGDCRGSTVSNLHVPNGFVSPMPNNDEEATS